VEDDLSSQQLVKAFLKSNYDVCVSTSVKDAKQRLKEYQVNIVLLDLSLEGKEDGLDLIKWMRRTKTWKKTPVIATTAPAFTTDQINCFKAGCNEYLAKPIRRGCLNHFTENFGLDPLKDCIPKKGINLKISGLEEFELPFILLRFLLKNPH